MLTLGLGHAEGKTIAKFEVEPLDRRVVLRFTDGSALLVYETCGSHLGLNLDHTGIIPQQSAWNAAGGSVLRYIAFPTGTEFDDSRDVFTLRFGTSKGVLDVTFAAPWEGLYPGQEPEFRVRHLPAGFDDFELGSAFGSSLNPTQRGDRSAEPWAVIADEYSVDDYLKTGEQQDLTVYAFRRIEPFDASRAIEVAAWAAMLEIRKAAEQHYGQPVELDDRARLPFLKALRGPATALAEALPTPQWRPVGQRTYGRAESLALIKQYRPEVYEGLAEDGWV